MLNQDRYFELYLAIAWAGAVVVPLNIRWSAASFHVSAASQASTGES
jgi:acyl-CoA synthetase (AMP-forming)/AMP-acid ligase II